MFNTNGAKCLSVRITAGFYKYAVIFSLTCIHVIGHFKNKLLYRSIWWTAFIQVFSRKPKVHWAQIELEWPVGLTMSLLAGTDGLADRWTDVISSRVLRFTIKQMIFFGHSSQCCSCSYTLIDSVRFTIKPMMFSGPVFFNQRSMEPKGSASSIQGFHWVELRTRK